MAEIVSEYLKTPLLHLFSESEKKQEEYLVRISLGREYFLEASDVMVTISSKISIKNKKSKEIALGPVKQVVDNIKSLSQKTWHDPVKGIYENSDE
jgi:hypothetical protein